MAYRSFADKVRIIISALETEMKDLGALKDDEKLVFQIGSPTQGHNYYVAVTGGALRTAQHQITGLTVGPNAGRENWLKAVEAYRNAIDIARKIAHGNPVHYSQL